MKKFFVYELWLVVVTVFSPASFAQPIRLLCDGEATTLTVPLFIDLERKAASFGGVQEIQPFIFETDRYFVWSTTIQYNEGSDNSSVSSESFLFDRSNGQLTTGFVSTDKPMNGMLGKSLHYVCRKDEKVL